MSQNELMVPVIDYTNFSHSIENGVCKFVAEGSNLLPHNLFSRIWNDACDVGFKIKGKQKEMIFCLTSKHTNNDNEITHWTFDVYDPQNEIKAQVIVFND